MSLKSLAERVLQGNRQGNLVETESFLIPKNGGQKTPQKFPEFPAPVAWLQDGELRTTGPVGDLAAAIVRLTHNDLDLQRRLLVEHCEAFDENHIWRLFECWEERAAIMEHDGGLPRTEAEREAARMYHLTAWLPELQKGH
ncbi:hypothetical protein [Trichloromonas sp.]|uniref:hypothetical protein n=1 Tax=Trichloromonas sp. TaxID=3069249 RepID=UPI002A37DAA7|nr:hypothetical protein [Trichloromonas sp.]